MASWEEMLAGKTPGSRARLSHVLLAPMVSQQGQGELSLVQQRWGSRGN